MKIPDTFLLTNCSAERLYFEFAQAQPIYDYHCHLPPKEIAENREFENLSAIWLEGDHYKWRAMRANGVDESLITGGGSPRDKHDAWCATMPYALRNPLYHWSHLELQRYFGIDSTINSNSACSIWEEANSKLPKLRVHDILEQQNVAVVCTTDDPSDSLEVHQHIQSLNLGTKVRPAFRPDKALLVDNPSVFNQFLSNLETVTGSTIFSFDDLLSTLKQRHHDFHEIGCRLSDHGLNYAFSEPCTLFEARRVFAQTRSNVASSPDEKAGFAAFLMLEFGRWDAEMGWTKQLHLGPLRNNSSRARRDLGPDSGFDSIGDFKQAEHLSRYLDTLDAEDNLPKMILYNVNPNDNYVFATMAGNFQRDVPGKIQFGSGWWYLDQKEGIEWQLNALSNIGLLRRFVGMITDSRSFLSYPRHEYFRRVLCNLLGSEMERGELPNDFELVGAMVREISYDNAHAYFAL